MTAEMKAVDNKYTEYDEYCFSTTTFKKKVKLGEEPRPAKREYR